MGAFFLRCHMEKAGIPTTYHGYKFRSRLEATWACFFDQVNWKWKYEPFDYDGYIPDFVLLPQKQPPVLVEIKPELSFDGLKKHIGKIDSSPWEYEALILGVGFTENGFGLIGTLDYDETSRVWEPSDISLHTTWPCFTCVGFNARDAYWGCRMCGAHIKAYCNHDADLESKWAHAQNMVQWAPKMFGIDTAVSR